MIITSVVQEPPIVTDSGVDVGGWGACLSVLVGDKQLSTVKEPPIAGTDSVVDVEDWGAC